MITLPPPGQSGGTSSVSGKKYITLPKVQVPQSEPKQSTREKVADFAMTKFPGAMQKIAEIQEDPLALKSNPKEIASSYVGGIKDAITHAGQALGNAIGFNSGPRSASEKAGDVLEATGGIAGALLSPISAFFTAAEKVPVLGTVARLVNFAFAGVGEAGGEIGVTALNQVPDSVLSKDAKKNVSDGIREISALVAQIVVAGGAERLGLEGRVNAARPKGTSPVEIPFTYGLKKGESVFNTKAQVGAIGDLATLAERYSPADVSTIVTKALEISERQTFSPEFRRYREEQLLLEGRDQLRLSGPENRLALPAPVEKTSALKPGEISSSVKQFGGFSGDLQGRTPTKGYMVSPYKRLEVQIPKEDFTQNYQKHISDYVDKNFGMLRQNNHFLGVWEENGMIFLDVAKNVLELDPAMAEAKSNAQIGVYDVVKGDTIYTKDYYEKASLPSQLERPLEGGNEVQTPGSVSGADIPRLDPGGQRPRADVSGASQAIGTRSSGQIAGVSEVVDGANAYNRSRGLKEIDHSESGPFNVERAERIADAYDKLPIDDSKNPAVIKAYNALKEEIAKQWDYATQKLGVKFEEWADTKTQPYKDSAEMIADIRDNNHLYFFKGGEPHPFLDAFEPIRGQTFNEMFRAVHDYFGHSAGGNKFGPKGEENAWYTHSQMFSPEARKAMTTETRGQNSWVNFGKQNYGADGKYLNLPFAERGYAKQKVALLPDDYVTLTEKGKGIQGRGFTMTDKADPAKIEASQFLKEYNELRRSTIERPTPTKIARLRKMMQKANSIKVPQEAGTKPKPTFRIARLQTPGKIKLDSPTGSLGQTTKVQAPVEPIRAEIDGQRVTKAASDISKKYAEEGFGKLPDEELAKYTPTTKKLVEEEVARILEDSEHTKQIVSGEAEAPNPAVGQVLFNALEEKAMREGNMSLMEDLSRSPLATQLSEAGQALGAHGYSDNPNSPVKTILQVNKTLRENANKKSKGIEAKVRPEKEALKKEIKPVTKETWSSFIDSLIC